MFWMVYLGSAMVILAQAFERPTPTLTQQATGHNKLAEQKTTQVSSRGESLGELSMGLEVLSRIWLQVSSVRGCARHQPYRVLQLSTPCLMLSQARLPNSCPFSISSSVLGWRIYEHQRLSGTKRAQSCRLADWSRG